MLTESQLEARLSYMTGSDASVACGVNPWKNRVQLWQEKMRIISPPDISDQPQIKAGNYLEPVVRQWYSDETGKQVIEFPEEAEGYKLAKDNMIISLSNPFMAANVDGVIPAERAVFEAKTSSFPHGWGKDGDNTIPDYYLCQIAHYVACLDYDRAYLAVLIGGNDFRHYHYERSATLEDMIIKKEKEFWNLVQTEIAPDPLNAEEVLSLHGYSSNGQAIAADYEVNEAVERLIEVKETIKQYKDKQEALENQVKVYMSENDTLVGLDGRIAITWKEAKPAVRLDTKAIKEKEPSLYDKYAKESKPTRRFLVK